MHYASRNLSHLLIEEGSHKTALPYAMIAIQKLPLGPTPEKIRMEKGKSYNNLTGIQNRMGDKVTAKANFRKACELGNQKTRVYCF